MTIALRFCLGWRAGQRFAGHAVQLSQGSGRDCCFACAPAWQGPAVRFDPRGLSVLRVLLEDPQPASRWVMQVAHRRSGGSAPLASVRQAAGPAELTSALSANSLQLAGSLPGIWLATPTLRCKSVLNRQDQQVPPHERWAQVRLNIRVPLPPPRPGLLSKRLDTDGSFASASAGSRISRSVNNSMGDFTGAGALTDGNAGGWRFVARRKPE